MRRCISKILLYVFFILICVLSCFPVLVLFAGSLTGTQELSASLGGLFADEGRTSLVLFPAFPTLSGYIKVLFDTPEFHVVFWNSVKLTLGIVVGQLVVSVPAAWGFSRWHGRFSSVLFYLYTILMLLPFQVTMLSSYQMLDRMNMLDTHAGIILPAVFSTFPVFIIYRSFIEIPDALFEAFSLESKSEFFLFWYIGLPQARQGIKAAVLLSVIECWNMLEQPLLFLKMPYLWPFSVYIPDISGQNIQEGFVFSFLVVIPVFLLLSWGRDEIQEGIGAMAGSVGKE